MPNSAQIGLRTPPLISRCSLRREQTKTQPVLESRDRSPVAVDLGVNSGTAQIIRDECSMQVKKYAQWPITAIGFGADLMRNWAREDSDNLRQVMNWYLPRKQELDNTDE